MIVEVSVKPGSRKDEVIPLGANKFKVLVKERAVEGRANEAVREALAEFFGVPRSHVNFLRGLKSKTKRLEVIV